MTTPSDAHLRRLPKVELHCHVEGAARASTILELAHGYGVDLPSEDVDELYTFTSLNQFLAIYEAICASLRSADDFRRITYEALEDAVAAGVRHREMFFSPGFVTPRGVALSTVWDGVRAGLLDARHDLGVSCRMVLDVDKPAGAGPAMEMIEFAGRQDRDLLVGVGGDNVERGVDHRVFVEPFRRAAELGLRRTFHAGEDGPPEHISIAVREMGCERVDHGFTLLDDPELTAWIVDQRIPLTVCPTSNVMIANVVPDVASHPIAEQRRLGVLATVNSDDPGMMRFDIADEYVAVADAFGWSLEEMEQISLDGIEASWLADDEKLTMHRSFLAEFDALRQELGLEPR